jgi:hypothetical protein
MFCSSHLCGNKDQRRNSCNMGSCPALIPMESCTIRLRPRGVEYRKPKKCFGTSKVSFRTIVRDGIRIHEKRACFATFLPEANTFRIEAGCA